MGIKVKAADYPHDWCVGLPTNNNANGRPPASPPQEKLMTVPAGKSGAVTLEMTGTDRNIYLTGLGITCKASHTTCWSVNTDCLSNNNCNAVPDTPAPTTSPTNAPQYQYSDLGSNSCPSGCSAINDLQTCKDTLSAAQSMNPAASQLGGNTAGTGSGGNYGSGRPGGCFLHNPNKHIHFNTDYGRRNSWRRLQDLLVLEQGQCRVSVISGP